VSVVRCGIYRSLVRDVVDMVQLAAVDYFRVVRLPTPPKIVGKETPNAAPSDGTAPLGVDVLQINYFMAHGSWLLAPGSWLDTVTGNGSGTVIVPELRYGTVPVPYMCFA